MECCRDVLVEFGEPALADALPWLAESDPGAAPELPPERRARTLSIAVQLLSIVEQRAAHPTEAKGATVLEHHPALYLLLIRRADLRWTPSEQGAIRCEALARLTVLWRTGEIVLEKPDVASARPNIAHYLRNGFPDLLALHDERLRQAWTTAGLEAGSHHERAQSTCAGGPDVGGCCLGRSLGVSGPAGRPQDPHDGADEDPPARGQPPAARGSVPPHANDGHVTATLGACAAMAGIVARSEARAR